MAAHAHKSMSKLAKAVRSLGLCNWSENQKSRLGLESLESRQYLTLLGISPNSPIIVFDSTGVINYSAANETFDVSGTPLRFLSTTPPGTVIDQSPTLAIHIKVDNSGNLIGSGAASSDITITGGVDVDGDSVDDYTGTLLTGKILAFGSTNGGLTTNSFDMQFTAVGGSLAPLYAGQDIGVDVSSENSTTFTGVFTSDFTGGAKGTVGPVPTLPGSISGIKYQDLTGNGFSSDDTPLGGTTIDLFNDANADNVPDGPAIATTVSAAGTGAFSFGNLQPGTYLVQEEVPAGYQQTAPLSPSFYDVTVGSGQNVTGKNFDNEKLGSISGYKYLDVSGNGFSNDDTPLGGVTINLFKDADSDGKLTAADGAAVATTTTAAGTGAYSFNNLVPGTYFVQESVPSGYAQTAGGTYTVVMTGQTVTGDNFDDAKVGSISGYKYLDVTGNGFTSDDTPLGGVTIDLFKDMNNDGKLTSADGAAIATASTAAGTGAYSFNNLLPGTYFVQEVVPTGYQQTAGGTYKVVMTGQTCTGDNFDDEKLGSISGIKYKDLQGDGYTPDDTPLGGVTVNLYKDVNGDGVLSSSDGAAIATTTTANGTGAYSFNNLTPGKYLVAEVVPTGWLRTGPTNVGYYAATITGAGTIVTGDNFDDYQIGDCITDIKNVYYKDGYNTFTDLTGNTNEGDKVTVTFTVKPGEAPMQYTLVVYKAPGPSFDANTSMQQTIYQVSTGTFGPGTYSLSVTLPYSYYQVDFICGQALKVLGPAGSNIYYSQQNRLIDSDNDGTNSDITGLSAQASFWASSKGQALIKGLNVTSGNTNPTALANWLASTFPKLAGTSSGANNLTGKHDSDIAAAMLALYSGGQTLQADLLATALDVYVSTISLGGATTAITADGFTPTTAGLGASVFNVGSNGAAFGVSNNSTQTVLQLLQGVNNLAVSGNPYNGNSSLKNQAINILTLVDEYGLVS